jgi:hypothetical protein
MSTVAAIYFFVKQFFWRFLGYTFHVPSFKRITIGLKEKRGILLSFLESKFSLDRGFCIFAEAWAVQGFLECLHKL